ncbi:MAG: hypothetical protein ACTSP9_12065 [Promethearchaeota archaeon]
MAWGVDYQPFQAESLKDSISSKSGKYIFDIINTSGHAPELIILIETNV